MKERRRRNQTTARVKARRRVKTLSYPLLNWKVDVMLWQSRSQIPCVSVKRQAQIQDIIYAGTRKIFRHLHQSRFRGRFGASWSRIRLVLDLVKTSLDAKVNYWNTAEHVPEADNNLVIQERTRATAHRLHYQSLLKTAIKVLVMDSTKCFKYFPSKRVQFLQSANLDIHRGADALPLGKTNVTQNWTRGPHKKHRKTIRINK